jgi:hypothetical protein
MSPECQFWWNWGVNLAIAIGTLLTVVVALFGEKLRAKFFPPLLNVKLFNREGERIEMKDPIGNHVDWARYYFIHVWNARKWSPAEQTQLFLTRIEEPGPSGDLRTSWSGQIPIRWRNQEIVPLLRTIGPSADCDFCRVEKKGVLRILPLLVPNNLTDFRTKKCQYVAHLQARSTLADSPVLRVFVAWDGGWDDGTDEMKRHLEIKEMGCAPAGKP